MCRDILTRGFAPEFLRQLFTGADRAQPQFLDSAWRAHCEALIAHVPLEFTGDGGHGKGEEVLPLRRVVSAGGLHQPDVGDLAQIVRVPGPGDEPPRDRPREGEVRHDALVRSRTRGERPSRKALCNGHDAPRFFREVFPRKE